MGVGSRQGQTEPPQPSGFELGRRGAGAGGIAVLFVVHTEPTHRPDGRLVGRIIGVRKATPMSGNLTKKAHSEVLAEVRETLSPELLAQLQAVAALPDDQINTDDIPEVQDWSAAVRGQFYRPIKQRLTLRIDADIIDYFRKRAPGGGYQTAMNRALRASMLRDLRRRHNGNQGTKGRRGQGTGGD
jgi:uncharacterized protein (DUF4415 family)